MTDTVAAIYAGDAIDLEVGGRWLTVSDGDVVELDADEAERLLALPGWVTLTADAGTETRENPE